jgi:hypothetical protein
VDRVLASEAKGRGFDPRQPHQTNQDPRSIQPALPCGCRLYPHYYFSKPDKVCIAACQLAGDAMCVAHPKTPLTPLPLSLCTLQSPPATDIKIDIETVEKLIGEIIAQPLR